MYQKNHNGKKRAGILCLGALLALSAALLSGCVQTGTDTGSGASGTSEGAAAQAESQEEAAVTVTATELLTAYEDNAVAADASYKGKKLQITGTVSDMGTDILDQTYVILQNDNEEYSIVGVQCYFADGSAVASLSKGDTITVTGTGDGQVVHVSVKDCQLAQ